MPKKYCPCCQRTLARTAFARHRSHWDGLQGWCRQCTSYDQRRRYARQHGYLWVERTRRVGRPWPPAAREG